MAKQTFTTGQVLTAAQMTSLQETAMGGGPATAKTANYVLVAADAGTTVAMNAAGSTTITVNSGLFAAGDTVFIQNLGAGACTVTAGTATVATAGSLILPQNDAGILYFTSASAAIFYDYIQAGAVSPLTTKGDLYTFSTSDARLAVGANGTTLVADSSEATGMKWATPASGGKVLQVVYASTSTNVSISSTTYTDTNITATITPSAASSKVLILIGINAQCGITGNIQGFSQKLLRGSTSIFDVDGTTQAQDSGLVEIGGASSITLIARTGFDYLDSPSTTSAITYKVQARPRSTSGGGYLNVNNNGASSHITLLEIGA